MTAADAGLSLPLLQRMLRYHAWRVELLCAELDQLDVEALAQPVPGSFPTLGRLLAHSIGAEQVWHARIARARAGSDPAPLALPDLPTTNATALAAAWRAAAAQWQALAESLSAPELNQPLHYLNLKGEAFATRLDEILLHVLNHATYHSGQVVLLYRLLGLDGVSTDYIAFTRTEPVL